MPWNPSEELEALFSRALSLLTQASPEEQQETMQAMAADATRFGLLEPGPVTLPMDSPQAFLTALLLENPMAPEWATGLKMRDLWPDLSRLEDLTALQDLIQ
jgi:hypothetical protein